MVLLRSAFQLSSAVYEKFETLVRVRKKNEVRGVKKSRPPKILSESNKYLPIRLPEKSFPTKKKKNHVNEITTALSSSAGLQRV